MTALKPSKQSAPIAVRDLSRQIWEAQGHADRAAESAQVAQGYSDLVTTTVNRYSVRQDTNDANTKAAFAQSARIESLFMGTKNNCIICGGVSGFVMAAIGALIFTQPPKPQIIREVQLQPQYITSPVAKTAPKSRNAGG